MTRPLVAVALLALPAVASAQPGPTVVVGPPVVGGRVVTAPPITNGPSALFPVEVYVPPRFSVGGGSMSQPPKVYVPSGAWSTLNYQWPVVPVLIVENATVAPTARGHRRFSGVHPLTAGVRPSLSGESVATLVVEFPGAAEIWVGGQKRDRAAVGPSIPDGVLLLYGIGGPKRDEETEWTLTSPTLKPGEAHTFEVRGRWKAGGKTLEATRSVAVKAGDRARVIVVSGSEAR